MKKKETSEKYTVNYGCDCHEIDTKTLSCSLSKLTRVFEEINCQVGTGKKIELKVKALREGSFEVNLEFVQFSFDSDMFSDESHINRLLELFCGLIELLKHLGCKPPKDIRFVDDFVHVMSDDNDELQISKAVYELFTKNDIINSILREHFVELESDELIDSFSILNERREPILNVPRGDFRKVAAKPDLPIEEKEIADQAYLTVFRIVFGKKYKWQFFYRGNKIYATILDDAFFERMNAGEAFHQGDVFFVDLLIKQRFDKKANAFLNVSHHIVRVLKHIPRDEQMRLHLE